ncbi:ankyrin repeat-containing domain protein, partial [Mycena vulgaris]
MSSINFFQRQADILRSRQPGTGDWLLKDVGFKKWETKPGEILWCHGIPGAGKTVLACVLVADHLERRYQGTNVAVASMYLNHKETETQTVSNLLASVWRQLVVGKPITSAIEALYERHSGKRTRATFNETRDALRATVTEWSKVYVVVDALDEYPEDGRNILLEHLTTLGPAVALLLTSRPHISLNHSLPKFEALEIRATDDDIRKYVDDRIRTSSRLSMYVRKHPDLQDEIQSKIKGSVDGMFLLAKFHVESLATKSTIKAMRLALENLPKDLEHTYDEAMEQIDQQEENDRKIAHTALTWVFNSKRVLTVAELREALAIEPGTTQLDPDNLAEIDIILSVCAGLVIVEKTSSTVRLVHYTTQHYLESVQASRFPDAPTEITRSILTFLAFDEFSDLSKLRYQARSERRAFLEYCQYCLMHAVGQPEIRLRDMVVEFVRQASRWKDEWHYRGAPPWNYDDWPKSTSPLWIAAASNLQDVAKTLLETTQDNGECTALHIASYYGHLAMVQLLLVDDSENCIESPPKYRSASYDPALHSASSQGHGDIVRLLIEKGADTNALGGEYGTALQGASYYEHRAVVELLINHGAEVNTCSGKYGTALQAASAAGYEGTVRLLIESHHANVNTRGGNYGNALQAASAEGRRSVVQLLISHDADINLRGGEYGSALHAALERGDMRLVELLVNNGADVNTHGKKENTVLQTVARD